MPRWLNARGAIVSEKYTIGSGPNHSGPPTGAHRTIIRLEGPLMCIESATQSAEFSPGLRMARHLGGKVFEVNLGMHTFRLTCSMCFESCTWPSHDRHGKFPSTFFKPVSNRSISVSSQCLQNAASSSFIRATRQQNNQRAFSRHAESECEPPTFHSI